MWPIDILIEMNKGNSVNPKAHIETTEQKAARIDQLREGMYHAMSNIEHSVNRMKLAVRNEYMQFKDGEEVPESYHDFIISLEAAYNHMNRLKKYADENLKIEDNGQ